MGNETECTGFLARATIKPETKAGLDKTESIMHGVTERNERMNTTLSQLFFISQTLPPLFGKKEI